MLFAQIITGVMRLVFPQAPAWVAQLLSLAVPATIEMVRELNDLKAEGKVKFDMAVSEIADLLDDAFDDLPEWSDLSEEQRDRIVGGLVELAVFLEGLVGKMGKKETLRSAKSVMRSLRRKARSN
jgi:hypothetical protein|tara:strand:+ start:109 stop:483 length:375 start_codon:yes stop_codon:yes gene_type:complete